MSKNYLHDICQSLLQEAKDNPEYLQSKTLLRGLKILIRKDPHGFNIAIARKSVYPSNGEWLTILRELGFPEIKITTVKSHGWYYLVGHHSDP